LRLNTRRERAGRQAGQNDPRGRAATLLPATNCVTVHDTTDTQAGIAPLGLAATRSARRLWLRIDPLGRRESAPTARAVLNRLDGVPARRSQFGNPGIDSLDDGLQPPPLAFAGGDASVMGMQSVDDLVEGEPQMLQIPCHPNPINRRRGVRTIS